MTENEPRSTCYRCFRPTSLCLCPEVRRVQNQTPLLIIQHPRERTHAFNTVRLLELCLAQVTTLVDSTGRLRREGVGSKLLPGAVLLYPGPDAIDITTLKADERPTQLVVIDGTWHQAHTLYRDVPGLHSLPHVTLPGFHKSAFELRQQPAEHCLSTLEAVQLTLRALEPQTDVEPMGHLFRKMIETQLSVPRVSGRTRKAGRETWARRLPRGLVEEFEHLVVFYAESYESALGQRVLLAVSAERLSDGQRFDAVIARSDVPDRHLRHMGLSLRDEEAALTAEQFASAFRAFLRPDDILGAWSKSSLDALRSADIEVRGVVLKAAYRGLHRFIGPMEEIVLREGLDAAAPLFPAASAPRRHLRLHHAVGMARLINSGIPSVGIPSVGIPSAGIPSVAPKAEATLAEPSPNPSEAPGDRSGIE